MREPRYPLPRVVLDFTLQHCFRTNTVSGYAYDPTKTEVLAKDERITTESAGTVRNRPTESDVSSFSGRSVSRTANHPRRRDPNTSPDHSIGRSDGRGVLKATSADPWSASFMVETRTLFVFHKSKNFTSDYEIRMPPTACFEHSNFFKVTAPEARPGQLRPGAYRRQKRQADRNWKTDETRPRPCKRENLKLGVKRSTGKFAGKVPGKFTGDNPAIDLNPALDSVGPTVHYVPEPFGYWGYTRTSVCVRQHTQDVRGRPSAHTGRPAVHQYTYQHAPWTVRVILAHVGCLFSTHRTSVSTRRTSVAVRVCPCVRQCTQDVRQHTQDVRQHTQDVRGCPCVSVCPSVHTGRPSAHTGRQSAHAGRPSAHAGRPWLSVCVRVSVSAHRTSVSTHRTSVSTRRTSVAVRVCPCVRQHTQDVRQHTQDVRQHTQDVRAYPLAHTDCPWTDPCTELISAC
ncbi:hypothetical protein YC2023_003442 [Brassica napus]